MRGVRIHFLLCVLLGLLGCAHAADDFPIAWVDGKDYVALKELSRRWSPAIHEGFAKTGAHTALSDIRESVAELRHYRQFMGKFGGLEIVS